MTVAFNVAAVRVSLRAQRRILQSRETREENPNCLVVSLLAMAEAATWPRMTECFVG